ncbi:hypothetical protein WJU16_18580 [Chitinophaga pollutisoli]|uniref:Uncharacterized protein n=1 Tax=Chitinophaga pollutisoli TaxID=3133966 RepID=A0ABZ2YKW8_9BACT
MNSFDLGGKERSAEWHGHKKGISSATGAAAFLIPVAKINTKRISFIMYDSCNKTDCMEKQWMKFDWWTNLIRCVYHPWRRNRSPTMQHIPVTANEVVNKQYHPCAYLQLKIFGIKRIVDLFSCR